MVYYGPQNDNKFSYSEITIQMIPSEYNRHSQFDSEWCNNPLFALYSMLGKLL